MSNIAISEITNEIKEASELDGKELIFLSDVDNDTYTSKKCNLANIKSYVGDTGTTIKNQNKTVIPTTSKQTVTYDTGYTGLNSVTVNAISDVNLTSSNIKSGTTILGVTGSYTGTTIRGRVDVSGTSSGNQSGMGLGSNMSRLCIYSNGNGHGEQYSNCDVYVNNITYDGTATVDESYFDNCIIHFVPVTESYEASFKLASDYLTITTKSNVIKIKVGSLALRNRTLGATDTNVTYLKLVAHKCNGATDGEIIQTAEFDGTNWTVS